MSFSGKTKYLTFRENCLFVIKCVKVKDFVWDHVAR